METTSVADVETLEADKKMEDAASVPSGDDGSSLRTAEQPLESDDHIPAPLELPPGQLPEQAPEQLPEQPLEQPPEERPDQPPGTTFMDSSETTNAAFLPGGDASSSPEIEQPQEVGDGAPAPPEQQQSPEQQQPQEQQQSLEQRQQSPEQQQQSPEYHQLQEQPPKTPVMDLLTMDVADGEDSRSRGCAGLPQEMADTAPTPPKQPPEQPPQLPSELQQPPGQQQPAEQPPETAVVDSLTMDVPDGEDSSSRGSTGLPQEMADTASTPPKQPPEQPSEQHSVEQSPEVPPEQPRETVAEPAKAAAARAEDEEPMSEGLMDFLMEQDLPESGKPSAFDSEDDEAMAMEPMNFEMQQDLEQELERMHAEEERQDSCLGETLHKCSRCNWSTSSSAELDRHMGEHYGDADVADGDGFMPLESLAAYLPSGIVTSAASTGASMTSTPVEVNDTPPTSAVPIFCTESNGIDASTTAPVPCDKSGGSIVANASQSSVPAVPTPTHASSTVSVSCMDDDDDDDDDDIQILEPNNASGGDKNRVGGTNAQCVRCLCRFISVEAMNVHQCVALSGTAQEVSQRSLSGWDPRSRTTGVAGDDSRARNDAVACSMYRCIWCGCYAPEGPKVHLTQQKECRMKGVEIRRYMERAQVCQGCGLQLSGIREFHCHLALRRRCRTAWASQAHRITCRGGCWQCHVVSTASAGTSAGANIPSGAYAVASGGMPMNVNPSATEGSCLKIPVFPCIPCRVVFRTAAARAIHISASRACLQYIYTFPLSPSIVPCVGCAHLFTNNDIFLHHLNKNPSCWKRQMDITTRVQCPSCQYVFKSLAQCRTHILWTTRCAKSFPCFSCWRTFESLDLRMSHIVKNTGCKFKHVSEPLLMEYCRQCKRYFRDTDDMSHHSCHGNRAVPVPSAIAAPATTVAADASANASTVTDPQPTPRHPSTAVSLGATSTGAVTVPTAAMPTSVFAAAALEAEAVAACATASGTTSFCPTISSSASGNYAGGTYSSVPVSGTASSLPDPSANVTATGFGNSSAAYISTQNASTGGVPPVSTTSVAASHGIHPTDLSSVPFSDLHCTLCHRDFPNERERRHHLQMIFPCRVEALFPEEGGLHFCFCCKQSFPSLRARRAHLVAEPSHHEMHRYECLAKRKTCEPGQQIKYCQHCCSIYMAPGDYHCSACIAAFPTGSTLWSHWQDSNMCRKFLSLLNPNPFEVGAQLLCEIRQTEKNKQMLQKNSEASQQNMGVPNSHPQSAQQNMGVPNSHPQSAQQNMGVPNSHLQSAQQNMGVPNSHPQSALQNMGVPNLHLQSAQQNMGVPNSLLQSAQQNMGVPNSHPQPSQQNVGVPNWSTQADQQNMGMPSWNTEAPQHTVGAPLQNTVLKQKAGTPSQMEASQKTAQTPCQNMEVVDEDVEVLFESPKVKKNSGTSLCSLCNILLPASKMQEHLTVFHMDYTREKQREDSNYSACRADGSKKQLKNMAYAPCKFCDRFIRTSEMKEHIAESHGAPKEKTITKELGETAMSVCPDCNIVLPASKMEEHIIAFHMGDLPDGPKTSSDMENSARTTQSSDSSVAFCGNSGNMQMQTVGTGNHPAPSESPELEIVFQGECQPTEPKRCKLEPGVGTDCS